jgi:pilus assembly protein FimV
MIITCEACGTSFKIKTSLINETGSTVRCSKCQQVFIAYPKSLEKEKPADFALDESLEAKIDDVLGDEFEDEFSDLESEISLETAEISMATSEELFATVESELDDMEEDSDEPEIMMSDLEQDDDDILSLDALSSGAAVERKLDLESFVTVERKLDFGSLLEEDDEDYDDDSEILTFGDLGARATMEDDSEILSFDEIEQKDEEILLDDIDQEDEEIAFDDLESTSDLGGGEIGLDDLDSEELAEEDILVGETIEEDEVDFLDFEDEEVQQDNEIEMNVEEELQEDAEPEEIALEEEGGVDTDLDDLEKKSEDEDSSEGTVGAAGKIEEETEIPAVEMSKVEAEEDDFELDLDKALDGFEDLDLTEEPSAETSVEEDLGIELEAGAEETDEEEGFDLDLDLDAVAEVAEVAEEISVEEDDFELDLDKALDGFEDLDLTEEPSTEASVEEDLGIELEAGAETDDLGLDLDLDEFDELDLDLGVDPEELSSVESEPEAEDDDFDLDFDLDAEEDTGAKEETFELDLNIEPEPVEAESEDFDLDLDFDDDQSAVAGSFVDDDAVTKTEEFNLTQIEDVLDFDELPEPEEVGAGEDLDGLEMDLEESEPNTAADDDEMSIDLETMLDDEDDTISDEKEVSLETVEEREQKIEQEYKKTVIEERETPGEMIAEVPEAGFEETIAAQVPAGRVEEKRNLKKILILLILLIVLGVIVFVGMRKFVDKEEAPVTPVAPIVEDQGYLQIEMIANPEYKFVENKVSGEILVVTGTVTNRYDHPRSNIQVKGSLYDKAGKVIVTSSAYCGNMITDSDLTTLELKTINERLSNRMGDDNLNTGIESGKKVPFTVVFSNLPEDINELIVEVVQSVK